MVGFLQKSPPGWRVLKNGDEIGRRTGDWGSYPILDTGTNKVQDIYFSDIGSVRIYMIGPDYYSYQGYIDYVNLGDRHFLWRLDGKKKDVAIYDDMLHAGMHQV